MRCKGGASARLSPRSTRLPRGAARRNARAAYITRIRCALARLPRIDIPRACSSATDRMDQQPRSAYSSRRSARGPATGFSLNITHARRNHTLSCAGSRTHRGFCAVCRYSLAPPATGDTHASTCTGANAFIKTVLVWRCSRSLRGVYMKESGSSPHCSLTHRMPRA